MRSFLRFTRPALCLGMFAVFHYRPVQVQLETELRNTHNYHEYLHDALNQKLNENGRF